MDFNTNENEKNNRLLQNFLIENNLQHSFNSNPEKLISKSLSQNKLKNYINCPSCFFKKTKSDFSGENENLMLSNSIHFIADYLIRNQNMFPKSTDVLNFINFTDANLLETLKTDSENKNYDLLKYLSEIGPEEQIRILKGSLYVYGTAKRMGFEEVRKRDEISLNLNNTKNKTALTLYTKPDYTGRHPTTFKKTLRSYDNFLIDYKLNFDENTKSNAIQLAFYYLTHLLSNRNIHHYYILNLTNGNLFELNKINLKIFLEMINKFLILKSVNYRGSNPNHAHEKLESIQSDFLNEISVTNFGTSFASKTYNELTKVLIELEKSVNFTDLGSVVKETEINTILSKYPIKFD